MPEPEKSNLPIAEATRATAGPWLAIETAGLYGSLAAGEVTEVGCHLLERVDLRTDARSAQTLAPAIDDLLKRLGWAPTDLACVAVAIGPGSFTGLRVGIVTAKTLAYATGAAILGVDTLDALAEAATPPGQPDAGLWTVLDAQRQELFAAHYVPNKAADDGRWRRDEPTKRMTREALAACARPSDRVVGPIAESLQIKAECVDGNPTAEAVLRVAHRRWLEGASDSVFALAPQYHRLSAAEEKLSKPT